jgi:hypothetical protein
MAPVASMAADCSGRPHVGRSRFWANPMPARTTARPSIAIVGSNPSIALATPMRTNVTRNAGHAAARRPSAAAVR